MNPEITGFNELTFRVHCNPLSESSPGNTTITSVNLDNGYQKWLTTLTRNKCTLSITIKCDGQDYFRSVGRYSMIHFIPSGNRDTRSVPVCWIYHQAKMEVPLEEAMYRKKYQFDIVLSTQKTLCRESKTDGSELNMKDLQEQTQSIMKILLGDIHSVDTQFIFSKGKTYSNIGLWAHRSILSRHKSFADLIEKTIKSCGGNGTEPGFLTIHIDDFTLATFCCLLRYLYTGEIGRTIDSSQFVFSTLDPAEVVIRDASSGRVKDNVKWYPLEPISSWQLKDVLWSELLFISDHFGITSLRDQCEDNLIASIDDRNVIEILFDVGSSFEDVKSAGLDYIVDNKKSLFEGDNDPFKEYQCRRECYTLMVEVMRRMSDN